MGDTKRLLSVLVYVVLLYAYSRAHITYSDSLLLLLVGVTFTNLIEFSKNMSRNKKKGQKEQIIANRQKYLAERCFVRRDGK